MPKLEVTKTIEARMLNKRTRQTLSQPPVTIPYGDVVEFTYVGELYNCKAEVLRAASHALDGVTAAASAPATSSIANPSVLRRAAASRSIRTRLIPGTARP